MNEQNTTKKNRRQRSSNSQKNTRGVGKPRQKQPEPKKEPILPKITMPEYVCSRCNKPITDVSAALTDNVDGNPIHFDCTLEFMKEREDLQEGESIAYIGQGRFAVVTFPNKNSTKDFSIVRIIDWEDKNNRAPWRDDISILYSQIP